MHKLALIGIGGLLGTLSRYWLSQGITERVQSSFPYGTLVVNLAGCFAAGFLFQLLERTSLSPDLQLAIFTGFLGGFTTFSAYALQTFVLTRSELLSMAAMNVIASNILGLAMVWVGAGASRLLLER